MDWFLFALLSVLGISLANIFRKVVMKDDNTDVIASAIVFQALGSLLVAIFAITKGFILPSFSTYYLNFFIVGFFWAVATFFQFKAYQYLEASEAIIIGTLESIVIIIAANFFLKEVFNFQMLIGTALVLAGVIAISKTKKKITFSRGIFYSLGFCLFAGLAIVNDTFMYKRVDAMSYLAIGFLLPVFFLMLFSPKSLNKIKDVLQFSNFKKIFFLTFFYVLGSITFTYAILNGAEISKLGPISNSTVIVTVLLATIFLGERDHLLRKIICSILVTIGVLLLR